MSLKFALSFKLNVFNYNTGLQSKEEVLNITFFFMVHKQDTLIKRENIAKS